MIAIEEDVVDGVAITAVWAGSVITGIGLEASRVVSVESMTGDELERSRLVCVGLGGKNPCDEWVER